MVDVGDEWGMGDDGRDGWLCGLHGLGPDAERGAEVRFRYRVPADKRDAARAAASELRTELLAKGAVVVKLEEVVSTTVRARAPEVAAAKTLPDKLRAYWKAKGDEMAPERAERVLALALELEAP
jgi:hypothetical protein